MRTFPTVHKHSANCLLTAFQQEFNPNFFLWLVVSVGRGIVALWGLCGEDGATQREIIVCFYPQAIWVFWLVSLCLSKAMKAAGWLTKTGVSVTASDIFYTLLLFSPFRRCLSHVPVVFPLRRCLFFILLWLKLTCVSFLALHLNVSLGLPELHKSLNWLPRDYEKWAALSNGSFSRTAITVPVTLSSTY